ncbi:MAG TPA: cysteine--tRNA ligase [Eubacteriales bacterium]|nr:cysteine--tRNA ligase [Clostridia bacterium]HRR89430.1 cysteine--tRNA ligase [Eubacteriales bacterium]HRU84641.1 cysteine--tRNA ligase [Eubacteriales bacterium]
MLKIFNTLTRQKEEFVPIGNKVTMYSCGPTVYSYAHIGNMRTYIFMDLLRRTLKYCGYKLKGVMNITDVGHLMSDADEGEDKMAAAAKEQKKTPEEIAAFYGEVFFKDLESLNIGKPEIIAKATDHIDEMLDIVVKLEKKGVAYETSDGIYFDISTFPGYGKLSGIKLDRQQAGARVEVNEEKRNPEDFALWKKAEPGHIMQWDSPWGKGYPGWHIECSAMSMKYLGEVFDIHTGGVDHIPIHHENEIAQNEALTDKKSVNYWMHGEFMQVDGGKMSKSLKNTYTIEQLKEMGYPPMAFRLFCLQAHYRKKLNFTFEGMDGAKTAYERLLSTLYQHKTTDKPTNPEILKKYEDEFDGAVRDDLNIPLAVGVLFTMVKEEKSKDIFYLALKMDKVLGLSLETAAPMASEAAPSGEIPENVTALAEKRKQAKAEKNFALADSLRAEIKALGFELVDTKDGYIIKPIK